MTNANTSTTTIPMNTIIDENAASGVPAKGKTIKAKPAKIVAKNNRIIFMAIPPFPFNICNGREERVSWTSLFT